MESQDLPFERRVDRLRVLVDCRLDELVPGAHVAPERLHQAVRHSLLAPGKRIRPVLALLSALHFGADERRALDPACAIEMVHTASLLLDDLPAMDDARMRRGRPATHVVFGEDTAILAAIALLNQAFSVVARCPALPCQARLELVTVLADAVGFDGLVAGQLRDLQMATQWSDTATIAQVHHQKTGALFVAAVEAGARVAGASGRQIEAARGFATELGLAFQLQDDLVDVTSSAAAAGKDVGKDSLKSTIVAALGCDRARVRVQEHVAAAIACLAAAGEAGPLVHLARGWVRTGQAAA